MLTVILINQKTNGLDNIADVLKQGNLKVIEVDSEASSIEMLTSLTVDAVLATEQDLPLVKKLVSAFPMANYAIMSSSSPADFHEVTEGYGIFMQLPTSLQQRDISEMIDNLTQIQALSSDKKGDMK